uniref:Flavonoid 3'-monooxygenase n=1 Tax=Kalanchoe fedtschenkoi TaxID=63787 RepID=A0A7N0VG91_KALFE
MQLKLGSVTVVTTNSPDMARQFLKTHDSTFASRPRLAAGKHTTYNYSNITWSACGPHWRQGRKIMLTHLFSLKSLEAYERVRVEERSDFLARLHGSRGEHVRVKDHLSRLNLSVMSRIVLGRNHFTGSNNHRNDRSSGESGVLRLEEIQKILDELFSISAAFVVGNCIPWLARLDLKGYVKRMKILGQKFDEFLEFCIDEHMMARNGQPKGPAKDMMDVLLDLADDPDLEVKLTIDNVKGFTLDLLAGGTDTAATTVEWAMAELMKNPEKINTAAEELDRVIGRGRWVEEKDTPNLPYLDAILKGNFQAAPGWLAAHPARGPQRLPSRTLPHFQRHFGPDQPVEHGSEPGRVGLSGGVPSGEVFEQGH